MPWRDDRCVVSLFLRPSLELGVTISRDSARLDMASPPIGLLSRRARDFPQRNPTLRRNFRRAAAACPRSAVAKWGHLRAAPMTCRVRLPILHPSHQRLGDEISWRAKKMDVIRHHDGSASHPGTRSAPGLEQNFVSRSISEDWFSILRTDDEENNNGSVVAFAHGLVHGMLAPDLFHIPWNIMGWDTARPSK